MNFFPHYFLVICFPIIVSPYPGVTGLPAQCKGRQRKCDEVYRISPCQPLLCNDETSGQLFI